MLSDNIQYEMKEPLILKLIDGNKKPVLNKTYTSKELSVLVEAKIILTSLDNDPRIIKMNKLSKITDMIFNLNELDNSDNLEDRIPSNTLFAYYVSSSKEFTHFKPKHLNIRNSKMV